MKISSEVVALLARQHGPDLFTPREWQGSPLDKVRLLWGLSGVESSFGEFSGPKHENGYCVGGRYFDREKTLQWGCLAHCSFGPLQVMYANFPFGVSPLSLLWDADGRTAADLCFRGAVGVLNRAIGRGVRNLDEIVIHYNGPLEVAQYSARLEECMLRPMPEVPVATATT